MNAWKESWIWIMKTYFRDFLSLDRRQFSKSQDFILINFPITSYYISAGTATEGNECFLFRLSRTKLNRGPLNQIQIQNFLFANNQSFLSFKRNSTKNKYYGSFWFILFTFIVSSTFGTYGQLFSWWWKTYARNSPLI